MKILFICKKRNEAYGTSVGLVNSAKFVANALNKLGHEASVELAIDANCIDRLVTEFDPRLVIIEALWVTPNKFRELLSIPRHFGRQWVVRVHSKTPFLAQEGIAFEWVIEYSKIGDGNLIVAPNSKSMYDDLTKGLGLTFVSYLPNIYDTGEEKQHPGFFDCLKSIAISKEKNVINIGCFGAIRPLKNTLEQAIAARMFADKKEKKLRFHVNGDRIESRGDEIIKNLRAMFKTGKHELVEHPWMAHEDFIKLVRLMDLGIQVSMSESFNIVAADFVASDVPIVVSHDIEWMCWFSKADTTSAANMVTKLDFSWSTKNLGICLCNRKALEVYNRDSIKAWREFLKH